MSSSLTQNAKLNFRKFASSRRPPSPSSPQTTSEKALQGVKKTVALRRSKFSSKFPQKSVNSGSPHQSQISHVICQLVNQSVSHSSVTSATWPPGFVGHVGHVGHDHPAPRPRPLLLAYFIRFTHGPTSAARSRCNVGRLRGLPARDIAAFPSSPGHNGGRGQVSRLAASAFGRPPLSIFILFQPPISAASLACSVICIPAHCPFFWPLGRYDHPPSFPLLPGYIELPVVVHPGGSARRNTTGCVGNLT